MTTPFGARQNLDNAAHGDGQQQVNVGNNLLPLANLLQSIAQSGNLNNPRSLPQNVPQSNNVAALSVQPLQNASASANSERNSNYRDYSQVPADESEMFFAKTKIRDGDEPKGTNFPTKLHDMLSREEFADMISWSPHGRSWRVLKPKALELQVLPKYFRHGKYNSFMRQVNGWGFRRISQGPDFNSYYHEFFLRGMPHLCRRMRRASANKGDGEVAYDPDFRTMRPLPPLDGVAPATKSDNRVSDAESSQAKNLSTNNAVNQNVAREGPTSQENCPQRGNGTNVSQNPVLFALSQILLNNVNQARSTVPQARSAIPQAPPPMVRPSIPMAVQSNSASNAPNVAPLLAALQQRQQALHRSPPLSLPQQDLITSTRLPGLQQQLIPRQLNALPSSGDGGQKVMPPELILQALACLSSQAQKNRGNA